MEAASFSLSLVLVSRWIVVQQNGILNVRRTVPSSVLFHHSHEGSEENEKLIKWIHNESCTPVYPTGISEFLQCIIHTWMGRTCLSCCASVYVEDAGWYSGLLFCIVNNLTLRLSEGTLRLPLQSLVDRDRFLLRPTNPSLPSKLR